MNKLEYTKEDIIEMQKDIEQLHIKLDMQEDYINFLESQNFELKQRLEDLE